MDAKEKAKELVDKYRLEVLQRKYEVNEYKIIELAKQCALICVDDKIKTHKEARKGFSGGSELWNEQLKELQEVKQEIEKL